MKCNDRPALAVCPPTIVGVNNMRIEIATFARDVHENPDGSIDLRGIGLAPFAGESSSLVAVISVAFDSGECSDEMAIDLNFFDPDMKELFSESSLQLNIPPNPEDGSCGVLWHSLPIVEWPSSGAYTAKFALNGKPLATVVTHAHRKPRPVGQVSV